MGLNEGDSQSTSHSCFDHYKLYLLEGLNLPKRFDVDTKAFIKSNDPVNEWLDVNMDKTGNLKDMVKASTLYNNYIEFMENDDRGITQLLFKNILSAQGISQKKKTNGNYYLGIKVKNNDGNEQ